MMRCGCLFVLTMVSLVVATNAFGGQQATVLDAGGTETRLVDLTTSETEFGGFDMGSSGIPIVVKEFLVGPRHVNGASYRRWIFTDDVEQLEVKAGSPAGVTLKLRTGKVVSGSFGSLNPVFFTFRGKSSFGEFSLGSDKVKLVSIVGSGKPHSVSMGTIGAKATVALRDGTVLATEFLQRNVFFPSRYINVSGRDEHYASIWISFKRGEALVETELPFSRIREIAFDAPVVDSHGYSGSAECKVSLRDGTMLAGDCSGSETARQSNTLVGRISEGLFEIVGDLGYAIKSIQFSE